MNSKKKGMTLLAKQRAAGWLFLTPATVMIAVMSFYPMIRAFIISLQTGAGANMRFAEPIFSNYKRILADKVFQQSDHSGSDHAGAGDSSCTASEQQRPEIQRIFPYMCISSMCNIPGFLFIDLPFYVCYRRSDQQHSDQNGNSDNRI